MIEEEGRMDNERKRTHDVNRRFESAAWRSATCALRVRWNWSLSCVRR